MGATSSSTIVLFERAPESPWYRRSRIRRSRRSSRSSSRRTSTPVDLVAAAKDAAGLELHSMRPFDLPRRPGARGSSRSPSRSSSSRLSARSPTRTPPPSASGSSLRLPTASAPCSSRDKPLAAAVRIERAARSPSHSAPSSHAPSSRSEELRVTVGFGFTIALIDETGNRLYARRGGHAHDRGHRQLDRPQHLSGPASTC